MLQSAFAGKPDGRSLNFAIDKVWGQGEEGPPGTTDELLWFSDLYGQNPSSLLFASEIYNDFQYGRSGSFFNGILAKSRGFSFFDDFPLTLKSRNRIFQGACTKGLLTKRMTLQHYRSTSNYRQTIQVCDKARGRRAAQLASGQ